MTPRPAKSARPDQQPRGLGLRRRPGAGLRGGRGHGHGGGGGGGPGRPPPAARLEPAQVVRSGLVVDYAGALEIVRRLVGDLRAAAPLPLTKGATSYPPDTESGNIKTTSYILEGAGLTVQAVLDEPTAARLALDLDQGAVVDVGGGTTGVSVVQGGPGGPQRGRAHRRRAPVPWCWPADTASTLTRPKRSRPTGAGARTSCPWCGRLSTRFRASSSASSPATRWRTSGWWAAPANWTACARRWPRTWAKNARRPDHPQVVTPYGIALSGLNGHGKAV